MAAAVVDTVVEVGMATPAGEGTEAATGPRRGVAMGAVEVVDSSRDPLPRQEETQDGTVEAAVSLAIFSMQS